MFPLFYCRFCLHKFPTCNELRLNLPFTLYDCSEGCMHREHYYLHKIKLWVKQNASSAMLDFFLNSFFFRKFKDMFFFVPLRTKKNFVKLILTTRPLEHSKLWCWAKAARALYVSSGWYAALDVLTVISTARYATNG